MRALLLVMVALLLAGGAVWASASGDQERPGKGERRAEREPDRRATPRPGRERSRRRARARRLPAARCPEALPRCASVRGRVVFVEAIDPDGDGDLHVVVTGGGVTAGGLTAVDVKPSLRPRRDPRIGDRASAAGQVQRGSYGQSQIHAVEFHVRAR